MNRRCPKSPIIPVHVPAYTATVPGVESGRGIAAGELTGAVGFALSAATNGTAQRAGRGVAAQGEERQKRENGQP